MVKLLNLTCRVCGRGDGYIRLDGDGDGGEAAIDFSPRDADKKWAETYEAKEGEGDGSWAALAEEVAREVGDPSQEQMQEHRRWNQMLGKVGSVENKIGGVENKMDAMKKEMMGAVDAKMEEMKKLLQGMKELKNFEA